MVLGNYSLKLKNMYKTLITGVFTLIALFVLAGVITTAIDQSKLDVAVNCKVIDLQQQRIISSKTTYIRYLVITDKETFICENSLPNGKFNNSDIFWRLKKDSVYTFYVAGIGKSLLFDYRNILEVR